MKKYYSGRSYHSDQISFGQKGRLEFDVVYKCKIFITSFHNARIKIFNHQHTHIICMYRKYDVDVVLVIRRCENSEKYKIECLGCCRNENLDTMHFTHGFLKTYAFKLTTHPRSYLLVQFYLLLVEKIVYLCA